MKGLLSLLQPQNLGSFAKHQGQPCPKGAREGAGLFMCGLRGCISDIWNLHCSQKFAERSCGEICCRAAAVVRKAVPQEKSPGAKQTRTQPPNELELNGIQHDFRGSHFPPSSCAPWCPELTAVLSPCSSLLRRGAATTTTWGPFGTIFPPKLWGFLFS